MLPKVSDFIWPIERFGRTGHIHSMFSRSFNIQVGKQLIHVSSYPEYLSGFGLSIKEDVIKKIEAEIAVGNLVKIQSEQLIFYTLAGTIYLPLEKVELQSLAIPKISLELFQIKDLLNQIEDYQLVDKLGLVIDQPTQVNLQRLVNPEELTIPESLQLIQFFIGRGRGLTPSGDDLLVAYLATLLALGDQRGDVLRKGLERSALNTTDVSRAYLEAACSGIVSSPIQRFFLALRNSLSIEEIKSDYEQILRIGHTSGKDMGYGIYLALNYYQSKKEKE